MKFYRISYLPQKYDEHKLGNEWHRQLRLANSKILGSTTFFFFWGSGGRRDGNLFIFLLSFFFLTGPFYPSFQSCSFLVNSLARYRLYRDMRLTGNMINFTGEGGMGPFRCLTNCTRQKF